MFSTAYFSTPVILQSLTIKNFRNYREELFTFHECFNIIHGDNAQGKTNLLEAIHLLLTFRPFKQVRIEELISFGHLQGKIKGEVKTHSGLNEVYILLTKSGKAVKLNGKVVYSLTKALVRFNVVTFLPADIDLVKGPPQNRRKYLDSIICTLDPQHLLDLKSYYRALSQRNALLTRKDKFTRDTLDVWDTKVAELGAKIIERRIGLIKKLQPEIKAIYRSLSGTNSELSIMYRSTFRFLSGIEGSLKNELSSRLGKDVRRGHTSVGPHRDIIEFRIDGNDSSGFASQGEAKTLALALKSTEIELTRNLLDRIPILLLDDVISELDEKRRNFLFELLEGFPGQVFVTATSEREVHYRESKKIFHIRAGRAYIEGSRLNV
jgi:DNA replication and repair protein RecF